MTQTTHYHLNLVEYSDYVDPVAQMNPNFTALDTSLYTVDQNASDALEAASDAESTAATANTNASAAQSAANQALSTATSAQSAASAAATAAETAQSTANATKTKVNAAFSADGTATTNTVTFLQHLRITYGQLAAANET